MTCMQRKRNGPEDCKILYLYYKNIFCDKITNSSFILLKILQERLLQYSSLLSQLKVNDSCSFTIYVIVNIGLIECKYIVT